MEIQANGQIKRKIPTNFYFICREIDCMYFAPNGTIIFFDCFFDYFFLPIFRPDGTDFFVFFVSTDMLFLRHIYFFQNPQRN